MAMCVHHVYCPNLIQVCYNNICCWPHPGKQGARCFAFYCEASAIPLGVGKTHYGCRVIACVAWAPGEELQQDHIQVKLHPHIFPIR